MKKFIFVCLLTVGLMTAQWPGAAQAQTTTANVLVLYDAFGTLGMPRDHVRQVESRALKRLSQIREIESFGKAA